MGDEMEPRPREVRYLTFSNKIIFDDWLYKLKDGQGQEAIIRRINRLKDGFLGDHRYVGFGVWELRIHFGPGYRVYYGEDGPVIIILLCGGDKGSQDRDILKASESWIAYRRRQNDPNRQSS